MVDTYRVLVRDGFPVLTSHKHASKKVLHTITSLHIVKVNLHKCASNELLETIDFLHITELCKFNLFLLAHIHKTSLHSKLREMELRSPYNSIHLAATSSFKTVSVSLDCKHCLYSRTLPRDCKISKIVHTIQQYTVNPTIPDSEHTNRDPKRLSWPLVTAMT